VRLKISTLALKSNARQVTFPTRNYALIFFGDTGQLILSLQQSKLRNRILKKTFSAKKFLTGSRLILYTRRFARDDDRAM